MQWKLPFTEYFKSDRTRIKELSEEFNKEKIETNVNKTHEILLNELIERGSGRQLSKEQKAVNDRFPQLFDSFSEKMEKFEKLTTQWRPQSEIWPFIYNMKLISFVNGLSAFYIAHYFRRSFKLADGKTAVLNVYVPALALPLFFGSVLHHTFISMPITEGKEKCSICQCLTAGLVQSLTATVYPIVFSSITSIYFADYFSTYPMPDSIRDKASRSYLYDIWFKTIKRNRIGLTFVGISNFLFAFYLTAREQETIQFMYFSLLHKEYNKSNSQIQ